MRKQLSLILAVVAWFVFPPVMLAQAPKQIPRTPDGKPNFSGLWTGGAVERGAPGPGQRRPTRLAVARELPLTSWGREAVAYWTKADTEFGGETGDPRFPEYHRACGYESSPADLRGPVEITQNSHRVMMLHMSDSTKYWVRQLWIGREHPADLTDYEPKWMGHTVARWDGDTLVADTVRVRAATPWGVLLDNRIAAPHSEDFRMVERYRLVDAETLRVERTMTDPKTYTRPLTDVKIYNWMTNWDKYQDEWEVIENHTVCVNGIYSEENDPWFEENFEEITGHAPGHPRGKRQ